MSQCSIIVPHGEWFSVPGKKIPVGKAMKVDLAPKYRIWMFALLPATLGLGTAALWMRGLSWPRSVDVEHGLILPYRRKVPWESITKIGAWHDYLDGHVLRLDIHHHGRISKIPVRALRDGENVARVIIASFKQARRLRPLGQSMDMTPMNAPGSIRIGRQSSAITKV
jgi:hypothetical protein